MSAQTLTTLTQARRRSRATGGRWALRGVAFVYLGLKEIIVRYTEYWLLVFGLVLLAMVLSFRGGLLGAIDLWRRRA